MSFITPDVLTIYQGNSRPSSRVPEGIIGRVGRLAGTWRARIRERQTLARLEYRDLRDIGLSQWEVERELAKPFWRG